MTQVFRLYIRTENDAFQNGNQDEEIARILREVAEHVDAGNDYSMYQTIHDANGNDVGRYAIKAEKEAQQ